MLWLDCQDGRGVQLTLDRAKKYSYTVHPIRKAVRREITPWCAFDAF